MLFNNSYYSYAVRISANAGARYKAHGGVLHRTWLWLWTIRS